MRSSGKARVLLGSGYKATKIGALPSNWDVVRLDEITDPNAPIRYGVVQIGPDTPGGVPIVPIKHIRRIAKSRLHRASREIESQYAGSRVRGGDVLISVKGTIGEIGIVPKGFEGNIAREIARIRTKPQFDAEFIAFQLDADSTHRRIESKVVGSTRLEFSIHAVRDFLIAVPNSLDEQRKIVAILRTWDEAVEKLEALRIARANKLVGLTRKMLVDAYQSKGTKKFELSGVARILKGSQLNKLDINSGTYPVWNGGITPSGFHDEWNMDGETITISEGGNSCGFVNFEQKPFWLGGHCYALKDLSASIDRDFLFHCLKLREPEIMRLRVGSGLPNIQRADLNRLTIYAPPIEEQKRISRAVSTGKKELTLIAREIEALVRQKKGLMQKLLTGEWPVKVDGGGNG